MKIFISTSARSKAPTLDDLEYDDLPNAKSSVDFDSDNQEDDDY